VAPVGTDPMSQLTAAVLGPEAATALNAPTDPASSTGAVPGAVGGSSPAPSAAAPSAEDAFLERSRSVAERRGRPDAEPVAPDAASGEPAPLLEEEGFQVPSAFMRSALARLAGTGAFPEGGGEPAAGPAAPGR
jgi:hypothetical protein